MQGTESWTYRTLLKTIATRHNTKINHAKFTFFEIQIEENIFFCKTMNLDVPFTKISIYKHLYELIWICSK